MALPITVSHSFLSRLLPPRIISSLAAVVEAGGLVSPIPPFKVAHEVGGIVGTAVTDVSRLEGVWTKRPCHRYDATCQVGCGYAF